MQRKLCLLVLFLAACGGNSKTAADVKDTANDLAADVAPDLSTPPALTLPAGFRLGTSTSAHQVEGGQENNWTLFETLPLFEGKTAEPSGLAADHYNRYEEDFDWIDWMGLDVYRFSIEWSRIEPARGDYNDEEIAHYRAVLEALEEREIMPSVTLHHFTEPAWFSDLTKLSDPINESFCADGPSDTDFCFWTNPEAPAVFGAFCGRMAQEYGDLVDEWMTFNELQGYWFSTAIGGDFPPGLSVDLMSMNEDNMAVFAWPVLKGLLAAHVACYDAIHEHDTVDADGDGLAARVGLTIGTGMAWPAEPDDPADVAGAEQAQWLATFLVPEAVLSGELDLDLDGTPDEQHDDWADHLDILGIQYYASTMVVGFPLNDLMNGVPCMNLDDPLLTGLLEQQGCPPAPTQNFPLGFEGEATLYGEQHAPDGLRELLELIHDRYPELPLVVTENGYANDDEKRAASLVRHLEACLAAVAAGVPLEGFYHWSLLDNFEWGRGFAVEFGVISVDWENDLERSPTVAAEIYKKIAAARGLTQELLDQYGGDGPLPE